MGFLQHKTELPDIQPDTLFFVGQLPITNAMLLGIMMTLLIVVIAFVVRFSSKERPNRFQVVVEMGVTGFLGFITQIVRDKKVGIQLLPLIGAIFVFFGVSNIITLIPGVTSFTYNGLPMFRTPTNDFNMTFSVALAIIILTQYASMRHFGIFGHLGKFVKIKQVYLGFKKGIGAGMMEVVNFFLGLLDIISEFAKVFSLSLRLFGNMYAGDILAALLMGAIAVAVPAILIGFNLMVGIIQALVFGALTAAYYGLAIMKEEAEPEQ
jgi:F-type H+-transporting ATPase subunit a